MSVLLYGRDFYDCGTVSKKKNILSNGTNIGIEEIKILLPRSEQRT
jgi:hypothetical protein